MRASERSLVAGGLALVFAACVANPAPSGWLAPAGDAQRDPYGGWIQLDVRPAAAADTSTRVEGELIAVHPDSIFVLTPDGVFHAFARSDVVFARVAFFSASWGLLALWSTLGTLGTISHGYYLALSAPAWLIAGSIATAGYSRSPLAQAASDEEDRWRALSHYARFPAGLPVDIERGALKPKVVP